MCANPGFKFEKVICSISRKCIYILDHHCFFLGRCVGRLHHIIIILYNKVRAAACSAAAFAPAACSAAAFSAIIVSRDTGSDVLTRSYSLCHVDLSFSACCGHACLHTMHNAPPTSTAILPQTCKRRTVVDRMNLRGCFPLFRPEPTR